MPKETKKLDEFDRSILCSLLDDSRLLMRSLALQPGAKSAAISARIKSLEAEGVVKRYVPRIDFRKIGYKRRYLLFLKLARSARWEEALPPIAQMSEVSMLSLLGGEYDAMIEITARDECSLSRVIERIDGMGVVSNSAGFPIDDCVHDESQCDPMK